jgi:hypothetical protein
MKEFIYKEFTNEPIEKYYNDVERIIYEHLKSSKCSNFSKFAGDITQDTYRKMTISHSDIQENVILHENYLKYLEYAYDNDYGIIVKPDFFWYTILCEITKIINEDSNTFKKYFTSNDEKELIIALKSENNILDLNSIFEQLINDKIPSAFTDDLIIPKFSTSTEKSEMAFKAAFLDAMSQYYNFGAYFCGYCRIKILGEISDYQKMISTMNKISEIIPELQNYLDLCCTYIECLIENWEDKDFWFDICKTSYGYAEHLVDGWFTKFFFNIKNKSQTAFPSHISKINFKDLDTDIDYRMHVGILSSTIENEYMIPEFNTVIMKLD